MRDKTMKKCVIIGGSSGVGSAFCEELTSKCEDIVVVDVKEPAAISNNVSFLKFDISKDDPKVLKELLKDTDCLVITAGIGRVAPFENLSVEEIKKTIDVDFRFVPIIISFVYKKLLSKTESFDCLIMGSIAGNISSPLFSVYGASKAGINKFCESLNIELQKTKSINRITCVKPVSFAGSSFSGGETNVSKLKRLAEECLAAMNSKQVEYYPNKELCDSIMKRYTSNSEEFGLNSFDYKIVNNRIDSRKMIKVGYMSGTFDLFHIGHLNVIKRAKEYCDYLVVGVHIDGSRKGKPTFIPLEERMEIVRNLKQVDQVILSMPEDSDVWNIIHYDYLFVGSDYKGTERFNRYEKLLTPKGVKIVYFPYTKGTSSTQLRDAITNKSSSK